MKTKFKRAVASLLALMLIVAAIPMSASAAASDKFKADLSVVSLPQAAMDAIAGDYFTDYFTDEGLVDSKNSDVTKLAGYATAVNSVPTKVKGSGTQADPYVVQKGQPFFVAVDLELTSATDTTDGVAGQGIANNSSIRLDFPNGAFNYQKVLTNYICSTGLRGRIPASNKAVWDYHPGATGFEFTGAFTQNIQTSTPGTSSILINAANGTGFVPRSATWDCLVMLTATGSGTHKVFVEPYDSTTEITDCANGAMSLGVVNYKSARADTNGNTSGASTLLKNSESLVSTPIYVTVESNDPKISITANQKLDPVDTAKVAVTLKNGTWATSLTAANFEVQESGTAVAGAVTAVTRKSDTVVELTIKGSALNHTKNYTIQAKAASHTATSGDPTSDIATTETFTVKEALTGTVALAASNGHTTSPVYGDTITATYSGGNAVSAKYQWKVGGTNKGTDSNTYTPVAADVGKTITCTVTDKGTNGKYGSVVSTATSAVAKKTLTAPVAADITNVPAIKQGATTLTANGTYTFKTSNGLVGTDTVTVTYVATYQSSATKGTVNNVSVALGTTLAGAQKDAYTFAGATVTGVKGEVSESKYTLNTTGGSATYTGDHVTGTTVSNQGGKVTGTVSAATLNGGVLSSVAITGVNGVSAQVTNDGSDGNDATFEFTLPATTDVVTVTVALTIGKGITTVAFDSLNKTYDGTTEFKGEVSTAGVTLEDFGITAIEYASADAANGVTINVTPASALGMEKVIGDATYKFPAALTGDIAKATATTITTEIPTGKIPATADGDTVAEAILNGAVKVEGIDVSQGKVGDYFTKEDIINALKALGEPIYTAGGEAVEATAHDATATEALTEITEGVVGDTYTFAEGTTVTIDGVAVDATTGTQKGLTFTVDDNGIVTVTVGENVEACEIKFTPDGGTETTINVSAFTATPVSAGGEEKWDFSSKAGQSISLNLTMATADGATALGKNFEDVAGKTLAVTANINAKGQAVTSGISFDTKGYGKASFDTADVGADGLIAELPTVTDVVKGAEFVGWSVDGTVAKIVDIKTFKPKDGQTLYAAFRGYMVGDGNGKVRPAANVTRAELAKMLVVAAGIYDSTKDYGKPDFTDVGNAWYTSYIACAQQAGIALGDGNGKFRPNDKITREEASILIAKTFKVEVKEGGTTDKVKDFDKVSSWAKDYVAALCNNGTISGYTDGTFRAGSNIKRMESATMTNHYIGLTDAEKEAIKTSTDITNPFTDINTDDTKWAYADLMFASLSVPASYYGTEITMPEAK